MKCKYYIENTAKKEYFLGNNVVLCNLPEDKCPYKNAKTIHFELDELTLCMSHGEINIGDHIQNKINNLNPKLKNQLGF